MLSLRQWSSVVFTTLVLALPASALEWKTQSLSITTAPFQSTQDVAFEFRNISAQPVAVLDLETNCDCLDATADQKIYAPGASGAIKARFTVGDRYGLYERTITVLTDEAAGRVRLLVRVEVPEIAAITPRSLAWRLNEPAEEKSIELKPAPGLEIAFDRAQPINDAFTARLEIVEAGRHYRLHLKPLSTAQPANVAVRISGREKTGHNVIVSAYGNVQ